MIAVVTALIGVLVSVAAVRTGRITPGKRLGHRVQLDTLLHEEGDAQDGGVTTASGPAGRHRTVTPTAPRAVRRVWHPLATWSH
ncbi:hypothetical protein ABZ618_22675 [Streptomyces roseolus]|uniref:hypothetical protein n=1 Tax=Streptomyces roseolus TaxID=67358 RepID=UPI0033C30FBB